MRDWDLLKRAAFWPDLPSARATEHGVYEDVGLADAAVASVVLDYACAVLTDEFDLHLSLTRDHLPVVNFTHLRANAWGL